MDPRRKPKRLRYARSDVYGDKRVAGPGCGGVGETGGSAEENKTHPPRKAPTGLRGGAGGSTTAAGAWEEEVVTTAAARRVEVCSAERQSGEAERAAAAMAVAVADRAARAGVVVGTGMVSACSAVLVCSGDARS